MFYERIEDLPSEVQSLSPDMAGLWLRTYNRVFKQTQDDMASMLAAWGAVDKTRFRAVKSVSDDGNSIIGWALMFTDEDRPDLQNTHFSHLTSLMLEYYGTAPLWYEHGFDPDYGYAPIGKRNPDTVRIYAHGVLMGHNLHQKHPQHNRTIEEAKRGELSYSSDSIGHYVDQGFNFLIGELRAWPFAGCSVTKSPAEPALGKVALKRVSDHLQWRFDNRPVRVLPLLMPSYRKGAGGAKGNGAGAGNSDTNSPTRSITKRGLKTMEPEMLAAFAELLGVEATPEAVAAGLQQVLTMLADESGGDEGMESTFGFGRSALMSALELEENAGADRAVELIESFIAALGVGEPEPDLTVITSAARSFRGGNNGDDKGKGKKPFKTNSININRNGRAPDYGIADLICAKAGYMPPSAKKHGRTIVRDEINKALKATERKADALVLGQGGPQGGYFTSTQIADDLIEPLYNTAALVEAGARALRMPAGVRSLDKRKLTSGVTPKWGGEGQTTDASRPDVDFVSAEVKPLVAEIILSDEELLYADVNLNDIVINDATTQCALEFDRSALRGTGAKLSGHKGRELLGVRNAPGIIAHLGNDLFVAANGRDPVIKDLQDMRRALLERNIVMSNDWAIIWSYASEDKIGNLTDTTGRPLWEVWERQPNPRWRGIPWLSTNQIPNNIVRGTNNNTTEIYMAAWANLELYTSQDVSVTVDTSVLRRSRENLIQVVMYVDSLIRRDEAFEIRAGINAA